MTPRMLHKMAEELQQMGAPTDKPTHPAVSLLKGVGGLAAGIGAGYLGTMGVDKLLEKTRGYGLQKPGIYYKGIPILAGAVGLATPLLMQGMQNRMRSDHLARQEQKNAQGS